MRDKTLAWNKKAFLKGQLFTTWTCCHCESELVTPKPTEDCVSSKGYWDGMKSCYHCGEQSFVRTWPDGTVEVVNPYTV